MEGSMMLGFADALGLLLAAAAVLVGPRSAPLATSDP
jgi:hypothetical protein